MLQKILVITALWAILTACSSKSNYRAVFLDERGGPLEARLNGELCKLLTVTLTSEYYILSYSCGRDPKEVTIQYPAIGMGDKRDEKIPAYKSN